MSGEQFSPAGAGEHLQRMFQDWYYAPSGPPPGGPGVWKELHPEILRVRLDEDWYDCENATGHVLTLDDDGKPQPQWKINLRDPLGIKAGSPLYDVLEGYMPAGVCFWAIATADGPSPDTDDGGDTSQGPFYEPLPFGVCCNEQSSSSPSSSSPSSSSPSSSSPSSSSPSSSSPPSTSPSTSGGESHSPSTSTSGHGGGDCPGSPCLPACPGSGTFVLTCVNGALGWQGPGCTG